MTAVLTLSEELLAAEKQEEPLDLTQPELTEALGKVGIQSGRGVRGDIVWLCGGGEIAIDAAGPDATRRELLAYLLAEKAAWKARRKASKKADAEILPPLKKPAGKDRGDGVRLIPRAIAPTSGIHPYTWTFSINGNEVGQIIPPYKKEPRTLEECEAVIRGSLASAWCYYLDIGDAMGEIFSRKLYKGLHCEVREQD